MLSTLLKVLVEQNIYWVIALLLADGSRRTAIAFLCPRSKADVLLVKQIPLQPITT
jgi:hypothetical protein